MKKTPHQTPNVNDLIIKPSSGTSKRLLVPVEERMQLQYFRYYMDGFKRGVPTAQLVQDFSDKYGVAIDVARNWRDKALEALSHYAVKDAEQIRAVQMQRLEHIYNLAVDGHQLKTAQSILDTMNKLMGLYKDSTVIIQPVTEFTFGGAPDNQIIMNPYKDELQGVDTVEDIKAKAQEIMDDISSSRWKQEDS